MEEVVVVVSVRETSAPDPISDHCRMFDAVTLGLVDGLAMNTISLSKAEKSYVQSSLLSTPPLRIDGRSLHDFRTIALETGVSPLANGSARLDIGRNLQDGGGGTEVLAAVKVEVEDVENGDGVDGGRVVCTVSWYAFFYFNEKIK